MIEGDGAPAPGLIVATDTPFSSNRFACSHQIHKFDFYVEPKEAVMDQLHSTQLLESSHPVMPAQMDVGEHVARFVLSGGQGART
jgi:hypothetical protein